MPFLLLLSEGAASAQMSADGAVASKEAALIAAQKAANAVRNAESAGANVSSLVVKFNSATEIIQQVEQGKISPGCSSAEVCLGKAQAIFFSIEKESTTSENDATITAGLGFAAAIAFSIFCAFILSFFGIYFYKSWRSNELKRFLEMQIRTVDQK